MRKIYQTEWFGLKFSEFSNLSKEKLADNEFYKNFYSKFYQVFSCYEQLPPSFLREKRIVADFLIEKIKLSCPKNILSLGCGNGYIEKLIADKVNYQNFYAIEPNQITTRWLENEKIELLHGTFPEVARGKSCDFGYMVNIDYCFNDQEYLQILKDIKSFRFRNFYLIDLNVQENGWREVFSTWKQLLFSHSQFWGYQRTWEEHLGLIAKSDLKILSKGENEFGRRWLEVH